MNELVGYRLSPQQRKFWQLQKKHSDTNAQLVFEVQGKLDAGLLAETIRIIIGKYSVFRTTFACLPNDQYPVQVVNEEVDSSFHYVETDTLSESEIMTFVERVRQKAFNLEEGPLLQLNTASMPGNRYIVALTCPGIGLDYRSLEILADQFTSVYAGLVQHTFVSSEETLPYFQFAEWQNQLLESRHEEGSAYWQSNRKAAQQAAAMLLDQAPHAGDGLATGTYTLTLESMGVAGVTDSTGYTPEKLLGFCWQLVLWKLFNQQANIPFEYENSCREFVELHDAMGLLAKYLPVYHEIIPQASFRENLSSYSQALETSDLHKPYYAPGEDNRNDASDRARYTFTYVPTSAVFRAGDAIFRVISRRADAEEAKIQLRCMHEGEKISALFLFNPHAFSAESIAFIAQAFRTVVARCSEYMDLPVCTLPLLNEQARHQLLHTFNETSRNFTDGQKTLDVLFEEQVEAHPQRIAVVSRGQRLTYKALHERAGALAAHLHQSMQIGPGDRVGLMCGNNEHLVVAMIAVVKAGAAYVPVDPANPAERINFILEDSCVKVLLAGSDFTEKVALCSAPVVWLDEELQQPVVHPGTVAPARRSAESIVYLIYTSGTTGRPKGVMIADSSLVNYVCWLKSTFNITADDSSILLSSYAFDLGYTSIWGTLLSGGSLHLVADGLTKAPEALIDYLVAHRITFVKTTPSLFGVMISAANNAYLSKSCLRLLLLGGEQIRVPHLQHLLQLKADVRLVNHYGPTETTIGAVAHLIDADTLTKYARLPVIGKPIANNSIYILDGHNQPTAPGTSGELCISGAGLARGYWNREEISRQKFTDNPLMPGMRMYRTGDLACWLPDGTILYLGRKDDQLKIRGYRVELEEVQRALCRVPIIKESAVVARDTDAGKELVAYLVSEQPVRQNEIREQLGEWLPEPMIPSFFVQLKSLPLTANGKLDKKALPAPGKDGAGGSAYVAPRTETEHKLVKLWEQVLGVSGIGIKNNFFDLGGHSIKAIQLVSQLHKQHNVRTDLGKVFAHPTVEELAEVLQAEQKNQFVGIKPLGAAPDYALSHAQQRLWVLSQFENGSSAYNVPSASILTGNVRIDAFKNAFNQAIRRHENLRTIFVNTDEGPRQKILPAESTGFVLHEKDWRNDPDAEQRIKECIADDAKQVFNLSEGPLLRATLIRVADEKYVFLFNIHHIISDGWSRGILIRELLELYTVYGTDAGMHLPPLRIQYKDYAAWHHASYSAQGAFWREMYKDGIPSLAFPTDFARPKVITFSGAIVHRALPAALTESLQQMASGMNITLNSLLLSLYGILVARYGQQQEVVIGSLASGRSHADLENIIGVFINFLPVRLSPENNLTLSEYVKTSNARLVAAYQNQDYPFDVMVDTMIQGRNMASNPFFDTLINFHSEDDLAGSIQLGGDAIRKAGLSISAYEADDTDIPSTLDFKLDVWLKENGLELALGYNRNLFRRESMEAFLDHFTVLLEQVVKEAGKQLQEYTFWTEEEAGLLAEKRRSNAALAGSQAVPVALCATFVCDPLQEYLEYWSGELDLNFRVALSPYNQVFQQLLDRGSTLGSNAGVNVLLLRLEDWLREMPGASVSNQLAHLDQISHELKHAFTQAMSCAAAPYLVGIFPPSTRYAPDGPVAGRISALNEEIAAFAENLARCYVLDLAEVARLYAVDEVFDAKSDEVGHIPFSREYYAALGTYLARKINALNMPPYKVIALDCDNTLWKGICGEAGALGVEVDDDCMYLQQFVIGKYREGFLLVLCSKNNEEDVWEVFDRNPGMQLKREHVAAHRVNWKPKADNLAALALELNLGISSFIFLDDNPFEVEQVAAALPDALALALPEETGAFPDFFDHMWAFDRFTITEEDRMRNQLYKTDQQRESERINYNDLEAFLKTLELKVTITPLDEHNLERSFQLMQRTNQFNLNGIRRTQPEMMNLLPAPGALNWTIAVKDRFGEYGQVGLLLGTIQNEVLWIDSFLLSCRALGKNVEECVVAELSLFCNAHGISSLRAAYRETRKNKPFAAFLNSTGWQADPHAGFYEKKVPMPAEDFNQ